MTVKTRIWCLALVGLLALAVGGTALAGEPDLRAAFYSAELQLESAAGGGETDGSPLYNLTGTWFGHNSWGQVYMITITRTGLGKFVGMSEANTDPDAPHIGATRVTDGHGPIVRTGRNTYRMTSTFIYGNDDFTVYPYFGTLLIGTANGTIIQTGPDEFIGELWSEMSCNPCWPGCWGDQTTCDPGQLWDPFSDPYAICLGEEYNPLYLVYRRMPADEPCGP